MNTIKILAAVADALILVANAINEEVVEEAAPAKKPAASKITKKKTSKKVAPKEEIVEEPETEEVDALEGADDEEPESQFKDVKQFTTALRALVKKGETDNAKLIALSETFGGPIKDLDQSRWDEFYERAASGE